MNSTVILVVDNDKSAIASITSVLESKIKPTNLCIAINDLANDNTKAVVNSFLKSCCDGSRYVEEIQKDYIMSKKLGSDINVFSVISKEPIFYGYKNILDKTDIFITMSGTTRFTENYIEKILSKFDDVTGLVYTDYLNSNKRIYLESLNPFSFSATVENIKEVAFSKRVLNEIPKSFNIKPIIGSAYQKSLVKHIPEALYAI